MSTHIVHWLGETAGVALGALLIRRAVIARRAHHSRRRLSGLLAERAPVRRRRAFAVPVDRLHQWLPAMGIVAAGWVVVGGLVGAGLGLVVGVGLWRWRRRQTAAVPEPEFDAVHAERQLPLAADLLAACIAAGAGTVAAARAVGEALGGPVGDRLAHGAAEARLGGSPADAWQGLAALPGAAGLARLLERADESGAPAVVPVTRLAVDARAQWARTATTRARRAAVMVTAPVGLCFLPAFIAVGVLPVVIGLAGGVLGGGGG